VRAGRIVGCALALAVAATGCALAPKQNVRIDEAMGAHAPIRADASIAALAPAETQRAHDALERAIAAWESREDPALVDHLAYVARQRAAIAVETARRVAAERGLENPHRRTSAATP
jgi:hypothetical protein